MGDVMRRLQSSSWSIGTRHGPTTLLWAKVITAEVPLAEMFGYSTDLAFGDPGPGYLYDGVRISTRLPLTTLLQGIIIRTS